MIFGKCLIACCKLPQSQKNVWLFCMAPQVFSRVTVSSTTQVAMAKGRAYDNLYARLETKESEKKLYRLARQRNRAGKDLQYVRVLKDKNSNVMVSSEAVFKRWKEYFKKLMNEEKDREPRTEKAEVVKKRGKLCQ